MRRACTGASPAPLSVLTPGGAPVERAVAYGVLAGPRNRVELVRLVAAAAEFGFYATQGRLAVAQGALVRNRVAAGATGLLAAPGDLLLDRVARAGNADDAVVVDPSLPATTSLELSPPLCPAGGCM